MKFEEALPYLRDGKKIKNKNICMWLTGWEMLNDDYIGICPKELLADDWEVEE